MKKNEEKLGPQTTKILFLFLRLERSSCKFLNFFFHLFMVGGASPNFMTQKMRCTTPPKVSFPSTSTPIYEGEERGGGCYELTTKEKKGDQICV